jgi:hypothetical protein
VYLPFEKMRPWPRGAAVVFHEKLTRFFDFGLTRNEI